MPGMSMPDRAPGAGAERSRRRESARANAAQRLGRVLRVCRVGLCFAYFGVGIWLLGAVVLPLVAMPARRRGLSMDSVTRRTQRAVQLYFQSFIACMMSVMRVGRVEWVNAEALTRGPVLVVANHPSLIDTPILLTKLPQADLIVSAEWGDNPLLRRCLERAGYLRAEHGAVMVRHAIERLRAGRTLVVYPEGSRTPPEGLRASSAARRRSRCSAGCDIVPVVIM